MWPVFFLGGAGAVEGGEAGENRSGDHRSPCVVFGFAMVSRRPAIASTTTLLDMVVQSVHSAITRLAGD